MRIVRSHSGLTDDLRGASAAIGNFDGVHLGHQRVLDHARQGGGDADVPLAVVTFEPHPREFFNSATPPFRLMNPEAKAHRLEKLGVDLLYQLSFDGDLAGLTAEDFAKDVLADGLGLKCATVGADFCFGKGRTGTTDHLKSFGSEFGFDVNIVELLEFEGNSTPVSSTRIRTALSEGRPGDAKQMLGHWHRIEGPVLHGEKRGRQLGFPTANVALDGLHLPRFGVYAVQVDVLSGPHAGCFGGVASLGVRPMFNGESPNLETFIFDFAGDLYDTHLSVALVEFLRPEQKFDSLESLVAQMSRDTANARDCLAAV